MSRSRVLVAALLAVVATWLASRDGSPAWTVVVGVTTAILAVLTLRLTPPDGQERDAREAARQQERVDRILARYEEQRAALKRDGTSR
jgi:hypothetical protein